MKDATTHILEEIYRVLSNANLGVNVYAIERIPGNKDSLFVRINSSYYISGRSKSGYTQEVYVNVDSVAVMDETNLDEKKVNDLNSKVVSALLPSNVQSQVINSSSTFSVYDVELSSGITFSEPYNNGRVIVKQNEFSFKVNIK